MMRLSNSSSLVPILETPELVADGKMTRRRKARHNVHSNKCTIT
jgi:hypothetical protein